MESDGAAAVTPKRQSPLAVRLYWGLVLLTVVALLVLGLRLLHWGEAMQSGTASYATSLGTCSVAEAPGQAGRHRLHTQKGRRYTLVTPANYRADQRHALLLVLAPAGMNAALSERFSGLTHTTTANGFLIAYANSAGSLRRTTIVPLGEVAEDIARQWCVAKDQVYLAGHSDGATSALALAVDIPMTPRPAGLVLSGAGWTAADLEKTACTGPMPALILHGAGDRHFQGYGQPLAQWWAGCNRCQGAEVADVEGCTRYAACAADTMYCETPRSHWRWAAEPETAIRFLVRQRQGRLQQISGP